MYKRGFTIVEILVVVIIVGILATLGYPAYENAKEDAMAKVSRTNMEALKTGVDAYIMEYGKMPGDLSMLPEDVLKKAYAAAVKKTGAWKINLAYFIINLGEKNKAYAGEQIFLSKIAKGNKKILVDPANSYIGGISYGLSAALINMTAAAYKLQMQSADERESTAPVVAESNISTFNREQLDLLPKRHKKHHLFGQTVSYAQYVSFDSRVFDNLGGPGAEIQQAGVEPITPINNQGDSHYDRWYWRRH